MQQIPIQDRVKGTLYGVAMGDSLGMPTEFLSRQQVKQIYGWVNRFYQAPKWHPLASLPAGSITDDTEQTMAIAEMVVSNPSFSAADVAETLIRWAGLDKFEQGLDSMGPSTLKALTSLKDGEDPLITGLAGKTNGAAIRISPVAIAYPGTPDKLVEQVLNLCIPTHFTDVAVAGGCAIAFWVSAAVAGANLKQCFQAALEGTERGQVAFRERAKLAFGERIPWEVVAAQVNPDMKHRILWAAELATNANQTREERFETLIKSIGTGVDMIESVPIAIGFTLLADGEPFEAVCMGANAGGDTDSVASICGALAGSIHGAAGFPAELLEKLQEVNGIDLEQVAEQLTAVGRSNASVG